MTFTLFLFKMCLFSFRSLHPFRRFLFLVNLFGVLILFILLIFQGSLKAAIIFCFKRILIFHLFNDFIRIHKIVIPLISRWLMIEIILREILQICLVDVYIINRRDVLLDLFEERILIFDTFGLKLFKQ